MLFGLVRPMTRRGSLSPYFIKRVPDAARAALRGRTLRIPFGDGLIAHVRIGETTQALRFSLRTSDPAEAKARQAERLSCVERLFASAAEDAPQRLNRKQAVALSGRLYRAWADDDKEKRLTATIGAVGNVADWRIDAEAFRLQSERMAELAGGGEAAELEAQSGRLPDHLLQDEGVAVIGPDSRLNIRLAISLLPLHEIPFLGVHVLGVHETGSRPDRSTLAGEPPCAQSHEGRSVRILRQVRRSEACRAAHRRMGRTSRTRLRQSGREALKQGRPPVRRSGTDD